MKIAVTRSRLVLGILLILNWLSRALQFVLQLSACYSEEGRQLFVAYGAGDTSSCFRNVHNMIKSLAHKNA